MRQKIHSEIVKLGDYLNQKLLPFWLDNSYDETNGGFLTHFDCDGKKTERTTKTFLMQIRSLFTFSSSARAGYHQTKCLSYARKAVDFILAHYWDDKNGGWFWISDRNGNITVRDKIGYGQCFAVYAFSEYYLACGDIRGKAAALKTYQAICENMADFQNGGFHEIMQEDWAPKPGERSGGDRKSLDVHMHLMEAFTTLYEMTSCSTHRRKLMDIIGLICNRMLHPKYKTGYMQFTDSFEPLPAIIFDVQWGRDAEMDEGYRPVTNTSYGHNVEFAWLLLHALQTAGIAIPPYLEIIQSICDHCIEFGLDQEYGGVYADGPIDSPTDLTDKQFWQQAEVMVGMLDAYLLFRDAKYLDAFFTVYDFVFDKYVTPCGEWYERVDRKGEMIDGALGHDWKINYHTVRSIIQCITRLEQIKALA